MAKISIQVINKEGFPLGNSVKANTKPNFLDKKWSTITFKGNDRCSDPTDMIIKTDQVPNFFQRTVRRAADNTIEVITRRLI